MPDAAMSGDSARPPLRTLADKINWLIDSAHPAGRGPYSNAEITTLIEKVTGEQFSHTTIWKLRNGQAANPQMRLIEALARRPPGSRRPHRAHRPNRSPKTPAWQGLTRTAMHRSRTP